MKKLMIAAAAAALIGGAQADLVYDFSASLKTTTAKSTSQSATYSYYFGLARNSVGEYWYTNTAFLDWDADGIYANWTTVGTAGVKLIKRDKKTGKGTIQSGVWNKLTQEQKIQFIDDFKDYANYYYVGDPTKSVTDPSFFTTGTAAGLAGEQEVYGGKKQWCLTIKWSNKVTNTSCYRVAGTVKFAGKYSVAVDNCCDPTTAWAADWSKKGAAPAWIYDEATGANAYEVDLNPVFLYRFGALTLEKSTKAELVARIGADDQTKLPQLVIAGQGSYATIKDKNNDKWPVVMLSSVSGNIVGIWIDPMCETCCGNNGDAVVFDCADDDTLFDGMGGHPGRASKDVTALGSSVLADNVTEPIWQRGFVDADNDDLWGTAAWGSFTLKYNQKESEF